MLKRILNKFEDSENPLLGPNIKLLKFWGLLISENTHIKYVHYVLFISVWLFIITQYIDVWLIRSDINLLLDNFKTSIVSTMIVFKALMFLIWQKRWKTLFDFITRKDLYQRTMIDTKKIKIIANSTKHCRTVTYVYWILTFSTATSLMITPIFKYVFSHTYRENVKEGTESYLDVVRHWFPLDKSKSSGYFISVLYQIQASIVEAGYITSFDSIAITIMVFFKTELILLRIDCSEIFGTIFLSEDDEYSRRRIRDCHRRHVELLKHAELFNSCLSPVMYLHIVICSIMLCASIYQIVIETNTMQMFIKTLFLVFGVSQLFLYCWHSNEVFSESENLRLGPYESLWWSRAVNRKKDVCILIGQFSKTIIFTAGPFANLSLSTFVNVLKGAYSYYTLIK